MPIIDFKEFFIKRAFNNKFFKIFFNIESYKVFLNPVSFYRRNYKYFNKEDYRAINKAYFIYGNDYLLEKNDFDEEYAKENGICLKTVYNQIRTGKIPATRLFKFPIIKKTLIQKSLTLSTTLLMTENLL